MRAGVVRANRLVSRVRCAWSAYPVSAATVAGSTPAVRRVCAVRKRYKPRSSAAGIPNVVMQNRCSRRVDHPSSAAIVATLDPACACSSTARAERDVSAFGSASATSCRATSASVPALFRELTVGSQSCSSATLCAGSSAGTRRSVACAALSPSSGGNAPGGSRTPRVVSAEPRSKSWATVSYPAMYRPPRQKIRSECTSGSTRATPAPEEHHTVKPVRLSVASQ